METKFSKLGASLMGALARFASIPQSIMGLARIVNAGTLDAHAEDMMNTIGRELAAVVERDSWTSVADAMPNVSRDESKTFLIICSNQENPEHEILMAYYDEDESGFYLADGFYLSDDFLKGTQVHFWRDLPLMPDCLPRAS